MQLNQFSSQLQSSSGSSYCRFSTSFAQTPNSAAVPNAQLAGKALNEKVDALLKQMTLEEKIGQTVQYAAGFATGPQGSKLSYDDLVAKGAAGSLLNVIGAERANHFQHIAMEKSRPCISR